MWYILFGQLLFWVSTLCHFSPSLSFFKHQKFSLNFFFFNPGRVLIFYFRDTNGLGRHQTYVNFVHFPVDQLVAGV